MGCIISFNSSGVNSKHSFDTVGASDVIGCSLPIEYTAAYIPQNQNMVLV